MSDGAHVLALRIEGNLAAARSSIEQWLVAQGIIEPDATDCGLGQAAHRPGPRALEVVEPQQAGVVDFRTLRTNGVEIETCATPTLVGHDDMRFACPACEESIDADAVYSVAYGEGANAPGSPAPEIACAACGATFAPADLVVEGGAFGNLVLRFWNWWPLTAAFIASVEGVCDAEVTLVGERV